MIHIHTHTYIYVESRLNYNPRFYVVSRVIVVELLKFLASASYREKGERSERQGGGVLARAGNPPATHLNCKWPERFSVPSVRPDEAFPRNAAGTCQLFLHLRVFACMRASLRVYAPSSLSHPLIRRSLPSPEAAEKFS